MDVVPRTPAGHPRSWRLLVAALAEAPALVLVAASALQNGLGVRGAATWMDPAFEASGVKVITIGVVLIGPPLAAILSLSWLLPSGGIVMMVRGRYVSACASTRARSRSSVSHL